MSGSRFTKVNEAFSCINCGSLVPPSAKTCRNHCPYCLTSLHVDVFPGDRQAQCGGIMIAKTFELKTRQEIVLNFVCTRCGAQTRNKADQESEVSDDYEKIISLNALMSL